MSPEIRDLLSSSHTIAVVGLSSKKWRPSHGVTEYMQHQGYRIFPVNPRETEVLGEPAFRDLKELAEKVDIVNVFRKSEFVPELAEAAIAIGARALWLQEGVIHEAAAARATAAGLVVVMDRCILKEHRKLFRA
ncbi:MAG: CoA-binding protein [bacterium]|nr:CoA-binding protein [bacterium]